MEITRPITIEFNYYNDDNEFAPNVNLTFRTTPDMTIGELQSFCKKFAKALGYADESVEEVFGEYYDDRI